MTRIGDKTIKAWIDEIDEASRLANVEPRVAAEDLVEELTAAEARTLAVRFLTEKVADKRRNMTLTVERSVERARVMAEFAGSGAGRAKFPPARRGTPDYANWVTATEEGRKYEAAMLEADAAEDAIKERYNQRLYAMVDDFITAKRVEWTAELLDSAIAMPDGTIVLWGDATLQQHQERRDMFMRNALANTEGAARHEQAIRELAEAGAPTLRELVSVRG